MANYNQVSYGSSDKETVKKLQELLNSNVDYNLATDGIFGPKTQEAVKAYQKQNNLAEDGIVGKNTWDALTKSQTDSAGTANTTPEATAPIFEYKPYQPSEIVAQAEALLKQQLAQRPGEYQSAWQTQLNDTLQKILNREKFSYDLNGDALYQQYKDQHTTQGKLAGMDVMGQAAALTGGYGNSYAQSVGQQAYQGYLQQLNNKIPELYQLALSQYNAEGDAMRDQASLMAGMEEQDYGRYRDKMSDYNTELARLTEDSRYKGEQDYGKWADEQSFGYQQYRDQVGDQQWQAQFDEAKRQYDEQMALTKSKSSSDGTPGRKKGYDNGSVSTQGIKNMQAALGLEPDGKWGPDAVAATGLSADEAWQKFFYEGTLGTPIYPTGTPNTGAPGGNTSGFTVTTYGEATAYLKANNIDTGGLMTQREWQQHKNKNNSAGGEHEANSYQEYLAAYIYGKTNK